MIEYEEEEGGGSGSPAWMATFADLMSLLMCFFVLLLSFSEMDVEKYKQIAGSMKFAFGVQNDVRAMEIPKGTSIIAQEFSSGRPDPTPLNEVKQSTTDIDKQSLDTRTIEGTSEEKSKQGEGDAKLGEDKSKLSEEQTEEALEKKLQHLIAQTESDADELRKQLKDEIDQGMIDVESGGRSITIRIREKGSFGSASATLNPEFTPVLASLREVLKDIDGKIAVEGHTDDVPIRNGGRFSSNWALSSSRALTVTHQLLKDDVLDDNRFMLIGHADTRPLVENTSNDNRARNRRVEIIIRQGLSENDESQIDEILKSNPNAFDDFDTSESGTPEQ